MAKKVLVGLSGGIDSTFAAYSLKQDGYEVVGLYMKLFKDEEYHKKNISNVQKVAEFLDIKYYVYDLEDYFQTTIIDYFVNSYKEGKTPNPCGKCNQFVKFGKFIKIADELGCEFVSTGHYINSDKKFIYEASDTSKDQTYFLFHIDPAVLKRVIFPLGKKLKRFVLKKELKKMS